MTLRQTIKRMNNLSLYSESCKSAIQELIAKYPSAHKSYAIELHLEYCDICNPPFVPVQKEKAAPPADFQ